MDQSSRLKQKEDEVSNLTTVVQKYDSHDFLTIRLIMENKTLKNQLFLMDRQQMADMLEN